MKIIKGGSMNQNVVTSAPVTKRGPRTIVGTPGDLKDPGVHPTITTHKVSKIDGHKEDLSNETPSKPDTTPTKIKNDKR